MFKYVNMIQSCVPNTSTRAGLKPGQPEAPRRATYTNDSWKVEDSEWSMWTSKKKNALFCDVFVAETQVPTF